MRVGSGDKTGTDGTTNILSGQHQDMNLWLVVAPSAPLTSIRGLIRLRNRSNWKRKPIPQRLKPDRFAITYGRPEGRPLQRIRIFPQPVKPDSAIDLYGTVENLLRFSSPSVSRRLRGTRLKLKACPSFSDYFRNQGFGHSYSRYILAMGRHQGQSWKLRSPQT
jgi:hypothetical protein